MNKLRFHLIFWLFIALYVFDYLIDESNVRWSAIHTTFEVLVYAFEFYINLYFLLPFVLKKKGRALYFIGLVGLLSISFLCYFLAGTNEVLLSPNWSRAIISFLLNHLLFILMSYFVWYFNKFEYEKRKSLRLANEKLQSEILLLKSQVSPHFLFNGLNNIYALALLKSDDTPKMISTLSDILRYFLYKGNEKEIYLSEEIEIIEKYILMQKFREISGMKNISFEVKGNPQELKIPPLIYISLIENAFKHGDVSANQNGFVAISFHCSPTKLEFEIKNSYIEKEVIEGIGIKNVKDQLNLIFENRHELIISQQNCIYGLKLVLRNN
jgi:sensor histidine kinase YesM